MQRYTDTPWIIIPARMNSTRLPDKPLAMIGDAPMIVQVWRRAVEAGLGPVTVACDGEAIAGAVRAAGGEAVLTDPALPSGSDRIWQAVERGDPEGKYSIIINLQGDLPTFDPALLARLLVPFCDPEVDIVTMAAPITREEEKEAQSVVKPVLVASCQSPVTSGAQEGDNITRSVDRVSREPVSSGEQQASRGDNVKNSYQAIDFVRGKAPSEPMYHHIGVYAYRREALKRFVSLPPSAREQERKLEQMRALDAGMRIACVLVDTVPLGVDTQEDLERARHLLQKH